MMTEKKGKLSYNSCFKTTSYLELRVKPLNKQLVFINISNSNFNYYTYPLPANRIAQKMYRLIWVLLSTHELCISDSKLGKATPCLFALYHKTELHQKTRSKFMPPALPEKKYLCLTWAIPRQYKNWLFHTHICNL